MNWSGRKFGIAALLCLSSATTSQAQSFSEAQRNAMNHVAQVIVAQNLCPEYKANTAMLAVIGMALKFDINEEKARAFITAKVKEHKEGLQPTGQVGCMAAWYLYGPDGKNVPNLLSRK